MRRSHYAKLLVGRAEALLPGYKQFIYNAYTSFPCSSLARARPCQRSGSKLRSACCTQRFSRPKMAERLPTSSYHHSLYLKVFMRTQLRSLRAASLLSYELICGRKLQVLYDCLNADLAASNPRLILEQ